MHAVRFNTGWRYWQETTAFNMAWRIPDHAREVEIPHDPMMEKPVNPLSLNESSSGYRDGGVYAYGRMLFAPENWRSRTVMLKFEGVYMHAMVYVNGQLAAKCPYGYTGFYVPLNDYLHYGQENEIRVMARSGAMRNSRWYSGAGIYRDVYLIDAPETYIKEEGIQIHTEDLAADSATVVVRTQVTNRRNVPVEVYLQQAVSAPNGESVADGTVHAVLFGGETRTLQQRLAIAQPKTWDAEHPNLYTCTTNLHEKTDSGLFLLDDQVDTFGIRMLQVDARKGLRVNGSRVELRGTCIHHDSGLLGAATWEDAQWRQVKKLKDAGFNAIRMSHHPMTPAMLRACDELGMYVMDEVTDIWTRLKTEYDSGLFFGEWWPKDVEAMIRKDYNHPCVILYSIGNEIPEIGTPAGAKIAHDMVEKIRSLDKTRFTLASINGIFTIGDDMERVMSDIAKQVQADGKFDGDVNEFMNVMADYHYEIALHELIGQRLELACADVDIAGYNYMTSRYGHDGEKYPNRVIVGSETFPPAIAENWHCVKTMPHVIGDFCWTGWDYLGESGSGFPTYAEDDPATLFPPQFSTAGDIEVTGFRKPASYYREIVFGLTQRPCIAVTPPARYGQTLLTNVWQMGDHTSSWTWRGYEGKHVMVEVYAPGDEVELLINGQSQGRKPSGEAAGFRTMFDTVYQPGEITAVCYENGAEISREVLRTAQGPVQISLENEVLLPGHDADLAYVDVRLTDAAGELFPDDDKRLHITLEGGRLLAFGNGYTRQSDNFLTPDSCTWRGQALAIIRREGAPITVRVEGEGLAPADLTL